jgi:vancomycin resistance protein YoaR
MFHREGKLPIPSWLLTTAIIFFTLLGVLAGTYGWYDWQYSDRVFKGVRLGKIDVGGKNIREASRILEQKINALDESGIQVKFGSQSATLLPTIASADAEIAYSLIDMDPEATSDLLLSYGRKGSFFKQASDRLSALLSGTSIEPEYAINQTEVRKFLEKSFSSYVKPGQDAQLVFDPLAKNDDFFSISPEKSGQSFNYDQAITQLGFRIAWLDFSPIELGITERQPSIRKNDIANADLLANEYLKLAPLTLRAASSTWTVNKIQLGYWLGLARASSTNSQPGPVVVALNDEAAKTYLQDKIASAFDQLPMAAKFQVSNGRVAVFQSNKDGKQIDQEASLKAIETGFIEKKQQQIDLVIKTTTSEATASSSDNLGITEIIGTGHSNFSGSPQNRRHNIRTGANALNGLLIKPGETFSVMNHLGEIDDSSGYLPELVIKGNKTTPEFGGGLCQVGTTMFRAALDSGLPITERRNHSYRVSYYEPAGTDATLYDPAPDLKFTNDTGSYVLIQSRIDGNHLYFDFWGTSDGRIATSTYPTIYNIVKPKASKIIETTDLAPGKKKCTEKAHNGADAYFDYQVTYTNGEVKKKRFSSHYVPWQEVCLVGVKSLSKASSTPSSTASSTPPQSGKTSTSTTAVTD